ncbi:rhamnosyltransferase WsaF family glycosyltransferase [Marimonas arenosa]|uniref:Glycosyltransferase n=1 Tax=Marimonas arenosa TaxID=1795305 RepID=A0AAE4B862_9RHOB|nr:glycosyltransferase [Marimonas arenosa]MDQ2092271.1 glycosyltransferase [Marimonas arenosa]
MPERDGLMDLAQATAADLQANFDAIERGEAENITTPYTMIWFLPLVPHALKGGVRTVFAFSEHMSIRHGTQSVFVIYSFNGRDFDTSGLVASLRENFPRLNFVVRVFRRNIDRAEDLPASDIAFCTLWTTAYVMLRYNQTRRKFYFMQDFEPMFYAGGDLYMMIEQTYRFGYSCIANTPGVGRKYLQYSDDMVSFLPGIDHSVFYPSDTPRPTGGPFRAVFYGRPENARNGFFLGTDILKSLKAKMGDRIEILSAGAEWEPSQYGLDGVVNNLGLLKTIKEVADLYRSCDLGLVFMATPHPSYQPLEYMACGCLTVTNINEANQWLLNRENALLVEPIPDIAANRMVDILGDAPRRAQLVAKGRDTVLGLDWNNAFAIIERRILSSRGPRANRPDAPNLAEAGR